MNGLPIDAQITFLYTDSLEKSAHFCEVILGLSLAMDQGACRIYHLAGRRAYLGYCRRDEAPDRAADMIFTLVTPDVDGWHERITAQGWTCEAAPRYHERYPIYHFFLRDPNGWLFEVQRFVDDDWDEAAE